MRDHMNEPEVGEILTGRDRLLTNLQGAIWLLCRELMIDPVEPTLTDRLYVLGELTNIEHRRDPARGAELLERVIAANSYSTYFSKYLGRLVGLLRKYDHERQRFTSSVHDVIEREEVARGSASADASGDEGASGTTRVPAEVS